ncbi:transcription factor MYB1R1 [Lycium ferocissimum]|uniref:transcription factor MYB1R1 n=1 Tax=Lycium ferocissimum TaxID=112874 RepID=UPI002814E280|nr:transcription factor MYB1R1 [Lycium ferocissimum]
MKGIATMFNNECFQSGNKEHEPRGTFTKGFMLFGVRVMEGAATGGSFRKSASMNNLALFDTEQQHQDSNAGYASDDVVHPSARSRERKRGVPWTEDEHKLFLLGLQKVGKGDWRGISRNFVMTRTPTQVASHAQKYFLRRNNSNRRRRRSSLFDITTDTVQGAAKLEDNKQTSTFEKYPMSAFRLEMPVNLSATGESSTENLSKGMNKSVRPVRPIPILPAPPSSKMENLNLNNTYIQESSPLSLKLSTSDGKSPSPPRHSSAFQAMSGGFNGSTSGDSIISVA